MASRGISNYRNETAGGYAMKDERDEQVYEDEELSEEEEPRAQRFNVVVVWSAESDQHMDPGEVQSVLTDAVMELDDQAVVEVIEVNEPTY